MSIWIIATSIYLASLVGSYIYFKPDKSKNDFGLGMAFASIATVAACGAATLAYAVFWITYLLVR